MAPSRLLKESSIGPPMNDTALQVEVLHSEGITAMCISALCTGIDIIKGRTGGWPVPGIVPRESDQRMAEDGAGP